MYKHTTTVRWMVKKKKVGAQQMRMHDLVQYLQNYGSDDDDDGDTGR